mmetsp:Transcript_73376/g.185889  ORF Transcript_73376/g.185889 Transcript_73376/m.185889 type:complete len:416 (-) Transcript_73376:141-1388(-)
MFARWRDSFSSQAQEDSIDEEELRLASHTSFKAPGPRPQLLRQVSGDTKLTVAIAEARAAIAAAAARGDAADEGEVACRSSLCSGGWVDGLLRRSPKSKPSADASSSSTWVYRPPDWVPLGIRAFPKQDAALKPGEELLPGEVFEVVETQRGGEGSDVTFLKLPRGRGWVFDRKPKTGILCIPYDEGQTEVELCTYKLTLPWDCLLSIVKKLCMVDADAYHVGVTVYGREWSYYGGCDAREGPDATGVRYLRQGAFAPSICQIVLLGKTPLTELEANEVIQELEDEWLSRDYKFLSRNCCHFSQEMCKRLEVDQIPDKVLRLNLYGSSEVVDIVMDGKEYLGRSRTEIFSCTDFCCGLASYGRKSRGRGQHTTCFGAMKQPYYWLRGVLAFVRRVNRKEAGCGMPFKSRKFIENH